jgi:hypothetical protein
MKFLPKLAVFGCALVATTAMAADHKDGPATTADPTADIADVYAFMDGTNVALAMTVSPFADKTTAKFSDMVLYTWHVTSYNKFGGTKSGNNDVICSFATNQTIQCWVGTKDYVTGDASATTGLTSASGKVKVFAGVRADPFYFYLGSPTTGGFKKAVADTWAAAPALITAGQVNPNGCPILPTAAQTLLKTDLGVGNTDQTKNDFASANVLAISIEIDKSLLIANPNDVISVWASTNHK